MRSRRRWSASSRSARRSTRSRRSAPRRARRARADRAVAADLAAARRDARQARRSRAAARRSRRAAEGSGAAPAKDAAPEDAAIAAERARLTQQRAEIDAAIKQVQLLQTRAEQLAQALADRRRSAYAETLFRRSPNVLDPYFWRDVSRRAPDYGGRIVKFGRTGSTYARQGGPARDRVRGARACRTAGLRHSAWCAGGAAAPSLRAR